MEQTIIKTEIGLILAEEIDKTEIGDMLIQLETKEMFEVAEVLQAEHLYVDTKGVEHWNNYDPWHCMKVLGKIVKEND